MAKFGLLGSSYIARLQNHFDGSLKVPGEVRFWGKGGLRTDNIPNDFWDEIQAFKPDCVFVHIGGNVVSTYSSPILIAKRILAIKDELERRGVKKVVFGELVKRKPNAKYTPGLSIENFEQQRRKVNVYLKKKLGQSLIRFKDITFPKDYCTDLVHFSEKKHHGRSGIEKYFFQIRRVLFSLKVC